MQIIPDIIKIAGEEEISKTIEELLGLNKLLPERTNAYTDELQEGQLAKEDNRWETEVLTEKQFDEKRDEKVGHELDIHEDSDGMTEVRLNKDKNKQRREDAWEDNKKKIRGHEAVPPIWRQVYKQEDDRKKLNKGQLDKKRK
jgi:hypothetical protein